MSFKNMIWRLTPTFSHRWLRNVYFIFRLFPEAWYDFRRYLIYSGINRSRGYRGEQAARITMAYHQLEKGLSLATPRPGFGKEKVERLLSSLKPFVDRYGFIAPATTALGALRSYIDFNKAAGLDMSVLSQRITALSKDEAEACRNNQIGGTIAVRRSDLDALRQGSFREFFCSRHSVRHFSGGSIPREDLIEAVSISQKTPSVCNRQAWKVHAYHDRLEMMRLLAIQSGNRGFGDQASLLLLITCDLTAFVSVQERYQAWIDGGMFSMSLCLAFHSLGYGTCCLNWSKGAADDQHLRKVTSLGPEEQVIMMIAVGTLPEAFNVASSPRLDLDAVLSIH